MIRLFFCLNLATWPKTHVMAKKKSVFWFSIRQISADCFFEILPDLTMGFQHAVKTVKQS
jgi:hypothetical protein